GMLVAWVTRLAVPRTFGAAALMAIVLAVVGASTLASSTRPHDAERIDPEARARAPILDEFDARRRPIAILYDPLARLSPQDVLAHVRFTARPGQRTARQPLDLLWNARFSLPAGEYRLAL